MLRFVAGAIEGVEAKAKVLLAQAHGSRELGVGADLVPDEAHRGGLPDERDSAVGVHSPGAPPFQPHIQFQKRPGQTVLTHSNAG
ncbi:hypothetical protein ACIA8E_29280 [Streptomyces sp. NPDC051664]|uniref:hypothetical protein n=1 Tax=Streptomyces sp. NPDC051664 TaxID=3365668 RepID=UPI0037A80076